MHVPEHHHLTGCFHASVTLSNEQETHPPGHRHGAIKRQSDDRITQNSLNSLLTINLSVDFSWLNFSMRKTLNPKTCMTRNQLNGCYHSSVTIANEHERHTLSHDLKWLHKIVMKELRKCLWSLRPQSTRLIFQTHFLQQRCTKKTMQAICDRDLTHTWVKLLLEVTNPWWSLLYILASQICTPPPSLLPTSELKGREGACLASVRPEKRRWWRGGWRVVHSNSKLRRCPQTLLSRLLLARPPDIPISR